MLLLHVLRLIRGKMLENILDFASLKPSITLTWPACHVACMDHGWNSPQKKQPETDFLSRFETHLDPIRTSVSAT